MKTLKIMIVSLLLVTQSYALSNSGKKALLGVGAIAILAYALQANNHNNYERGERKVVYIDSHNSNKKHVKRHMRKHHKHNYYNKYHHKNNTCNSHNNYYSNNDRYYNKKYTRKHRNYDEVVVSHHYRDYNHR